MLTPSRVPQWRAIQPSWQRLLLFLLPLVVAALLLWIPVRDALEVGLPDAEPYAADVPAGHHWVAFTVSEDDIYPTDGTTISVALEFETVQGRVDADSRTLVFDLEDNERVQELVVIWPDGREQRFSNVALNELHELVYPQTINDALAMQWALRGAFFRFWIWVGAAVLVILFGLRVLSWAQTQETHA